MSLMAYATTKTSFKFMSNERVTIDLELYFYPFYFICAFGMWLSVLAIIFWFIKTFICWSHFPNVGFLVVSIMHVSQQTNWFSQYSR